MTDPGVEDEALEREVDEVSRVVWVEDGPWLCNDSNKKLDYSDLF
jgi:hypothetical protein